MTDQRGPMGAGGGRAGAGGGRAGAGGRARVGMVGTGNMGGRMVRRLVDAGYPVLGVDADPARITACVATAAGSLAELAAACDVVMLSLPGSSVIETVVRGPAGCWRMRGTGTSSRT